MSLGGNEQLDDAIVDPRTYGAEHAYDRLFTQLRREDPVHWCEPGDYRPFWAVTKHADIMEVELAKTNFLNEPRQFLVSVKDEQMLLEQTGSTNLARNLVGMDDPDHFAFRTLTAAWFAQKRLKQTEDAVASLARETVDKMLAQGRECDFAQDIAAWYPLRAIMIVLGVPPEDEPLMLRLSQKLFGNTDPDAGGGDGMASMMEAYTAFAEYFDSLTADRRANPRDDVATILANAKIDGRPIGDRERNDYYLIIAAAGHDTTSSAISGGLLGLLTHPEQMARLRAELDLMPRAVDEFIRWTTPVKHFFRTAVDDYELRGCQIRAGDSLMMCYPSGNRDEEVFDQPFEFRIDRTPNRHLAFGYGAHLCLGQHLAKLEMRLLFSEMLNRVEDICLAGDPAWVKASFVSGLKRLPVSFRPAPAFAA